MSAARPDWLVPVIEVLTHPQALIALTLGSVLMFIAGLLGVPWFVGRLPPDYFSPSERDALGIDPTLHPALRTLLRIGRNVLGVVLLLLGVLMLFLPGQGLITMLAALFFLDFPGKHRLIRTLIHIPVIFRSVNQIRVRRGKAPLISDKDPGKPDIDR